MPKLRRINLEEREELLEKLSAFVAELKANHGIQEVYLYGSLARGEIHEGSDIDLVIVGDFKERFFERIGRILELTDLPIEPLAYTRQEFKSMQREGNLFLREVLATGKRL